MPLQRLSQDNGSLSVFFPLLNTPPPQDTLLKLTAYHSSNTITRYFYSTCGCHCFLNSHYDKKWHCLSGIIEQSQSSKAKNDIWPKNTLEVSRHYYVLDAIDGGLAPLLLNLNGRSIPTWSAAPQEPPEQDSFDLPHYNALWRRVLIVRYLKPG